MGLASQGGCMYDKLDISRGSLLCCKCFDGHLLYAPDDDPGDTACKGLYETRVGGAAMVGH